MTKNKSLGITIKGLVVGALILLLLIPAVLIMNVIEERSERQNEVAQEVSGKWAGEQTVVGPVLIVPYIEVSYEEIVNAQTKVSTRVETKTKELCYILPEQLTINGTLVPQIRKRSIFKIAVYQAEVNVSGHFAPIDFTELGIESENLLLNEAQICFGLSDFRGIEEQLTIKWNGEQKMVNPGMIHNDLLESGLAVPVSLTAGAHEFSMDMHIRGSEGFNMIPIGKTTDVKINSTWGDPSFQGNFLPNNPAEVTDLGFSAQWKILNLNRNYPQSWKGESYEIEDSAFGVALLQPTDTYSKTERSVKYAVLLIALTFVLYFLLEILQKRNVHPLQYVLVGLALCLFYTLLLSIGEYTGFNWAYLIASAATIALITWYSYSVFKKSGVALLLAGVLGLVYGFIFILLQLQDGALLFGSIGLFVLLVAIMYYSRKIDWQNEDAGDNTATPPPFEAK